MRKTDKTKLTKQKIDWLRAEAIEAQASLILWDSELQGYGIRAGKSGKVAGVIQWWAGGRRGKSTRHTVAQYGQPAPAGLIINGKPLPAGRIVTADLLRKIAAAELARVKAGVNPQEERRRGRERLTGKTFSEVLDAYLTRPGTRPKSWDQTCGCLRREFEEDGAAAGLAGRVFAELRRKDFVELRDRLAARAESSCRQFFAHLSGLMRWAVEGEKIAGNPIEGISIPPPPRKRTRALNDAEIAIFWQATEALPQPMRAIYRLLLLTGQRRQEVAGICWSELDLDPAGSTWRIPGDRTKNGREHIVDLAPAVDEILLGIAPHLNEDRVFPHGVDFDRAKLLLDAAMSAIAGKQVPPWVTHDLRRSFASGQQRVGTPLHVTEACLNHRSGSTGGLVGVYQTHDYRPERRAAFRLWADHVERLTGGNVVELREVAHG